MPKTRRAGRKNQLRRLIARHYNNIPSNKYSIVLDSDYYNNPEYERLCNPSVQSIKDIDESLPWNLVPITFDTRRPSPGQPSENDPRSWKVAPIIFVPRQLSLPLDIPVGDPRCHNYLEKRRNIIRSILSKVSEQRITLNKINVSAIPKSINA